MSLLIAEIIPAVTVPPRPKGFPIASTQSPTLALLESASGTGLNFSLDCICKTAMSLTGSVPINFALYSFLFVNLTIIPSDPWIT